MPQSRTRSFSVSVPIEHGGEWPSFATIFQASEFAVTSSEQDLEAVGEGNKEVASGSG